MKRLLFALVVVLSTACTNTQKNQNNKSVTEENNETISPVTRSLEGIDTVRVTTPPDYNLPK